MRTVSLELAKKLKDAGLQHQIMYGDWHLAWLPAEEIYTSKPVLFDYTACGPYEEDIWLPTLSDLLEWLEGRGWRWCFWNHDFSSPGCGMKLYKMHKNPPITEDPLLPDDVYKATKWGETRWEAHAGTPEDAAAEAVLWVLEQEGIRK